MLSLASCVLRSEVATPAQSLLLQEMKSDVVHVRDEPHFGVAVKKVADRWQVELPVDKSSLRTHRSRLITSDWQARPEHAVLRSLTTNAFSGMYLHTDYPDVRFRSHFRFGMAPTAKRRAYFDASVHPACPRCGAPEQSISHVLMECQAHAVQRNQLTVGLAHHAHLSLNLLLGDVESIPPHRRVWALRLTLPFVQLVYQSLVVP